MKIITDKDKAISLLKRSVTGQMLKNFSPELQDDEDIVKEAVNIHGNAIQYASERLRDNIDVATIAVKKNQLSFKFLGPNLKNKKKFILDNLESNISSGEIFKYCDESLKKDRSFVIDFIKKNAFGLKYCASEFKLDREIAFLALESNSYSFRYIKKSLRDDVEITQKALEDGYNFDIISNNFKNNEEVVFFALEHLDDISDFSSFKNIGPDLKNNKDFFIKVIQTKPGVFQHASNELKQDMQLVKSVLQGFGCKIDYPYSNIKELLEPQIKYFPHYLKFAPEEVINDRNIILKVIQKSLSNISYASEEIRNMLGTNKNEFIPKLKKIISIESLAEKLEKDLDSKESNLRKNKI